VSKRQFVQALKAGAPITDVAWHEQHPVLATGSGAVKVFDRGTEIMSFKAHAGAATAVAMHPSGEILASVGVDKSYVLYDLVEAVVISQTFTDSGEYLLRGSLQN
jgi:pre-mRNA-processing factor 19